MASWVRNWCVAVLLAFSAVAAAARARPPAYTFLTVTVIESPYHNASRLLLSPAFQGKTELELEDEWTLVSKKDREHLQSNTVLINQTLSELSAAGWELVEVHTSLLGTGPATTTTTRYLLRQVKS